MSNLIGLFFTLLLAAQTAYAQDSSTAQGATIDDGSEYYVKSGNANQEGASGADQPVMGLSKGALIGVIAAVVVVAVAGVVVTIGFYFHRRRSLELLRRRSMMPPRPGAKNPLAELKARRPDSQETVSTALDADLEKGGDSARSEFESETPKLPMWKKVWAKK